MTTVIDYPLTSGQQGALDKLQAFVFDPLEKVFVLQGFSGCGKSTLVRAFLDGLPKLQNTMKLINPDYRMLPYVLTATTNKAAENLAHISGETAGTIHSFIGLRMSTNFATGENSLTPKPRFTFPEDYLVFIDEASFIDKELLGFIFKRTRNCKFIFIGDPAQLAPVNSIGTPVFDAGFPGAALTETVRAPGDSPITDLSTKFRETVYSNEFSAFKPDGQAVVRMSRDEFTAAIAAEFTRPDWKYSDSKVLAWTNKCVIGYNAYIRNLVSGTPDFEVDDYVVCNSFLQVGQYGFKTDQLVQITAIGATTTLLGVKGNWVGINGTAQAFHPKSLADKKARLKEAKDAEDFYTVSEIDSKWADLRGCYASTVNKSQGSTYEKVFIDLDNLAGCRNTNSLARMLYVSVSRARTQVVLVGDLV